MVMAGYGRQPYIGIGEYEIVKGQVKAVTDSS